MAPRYKVVVTQRAVNSLERIVDYLILKESYERAEKVRNAIEAAIADLAKMPESKGLLKGNPDPQIVYRRALVWPYRIIFTVEEDELIVLVVEIDHQKMSPEKLKEL